MSDELKEMLGEATAGVATLTRSVEEEREKREAQDAQNREALEKLAAENEGIRANLQALQESLEERGASVPGAEADSELKDVSITRALRAFEAGKLEDVKEFEGHREFMKQNGEEIERRLASLGMRSILNTLEDGKGGFFIPEEWAGQIYDNTFRDMSILGQAGVTTVSPRHTLKIARKEGNTTAHRRGEGDETPASTISLGTLKLEPKGLGARTRLTLEEMVFGDGRIEAMNRQDLVESLMLKTDFDAFYGKGGENEPTGLVNTVGVNDLDLHSGASAPLVWDDILELIQALRDRKALRGARNLRFVGRSRAFFNLLKERIGGSTSNDGAYLMGTRANFDNLLPHPILTREDFPDNAAQAGDSDVFFGDFRNMLHARYGGILIVRSNVATDGEWNALTKGGEHLVAFTWDDVGHITPRSMVYTSRVDANKS